MFEQLKYNLKHNRRSTIKTGTAWFIFGAIILVFIFWGMNPRNQGVASGGAAVTVNEQNISLVQYSEIMERLRRDPRFEQLQALGGDAGRQILQQQALSQLVEIELIRQATEKAHVLTSDAEVRDVIVGIPAFQENGQFKRELYKGYVDSVRKTPSEFEEEIRREQSLRRTVQLFAASMKPLKLEAEKEKSLSAMKANVEFASVPTETLVIAETIPQAEIKAFMAAAGNDAKVKDYYNSHKADFSSPEKVKVRHILIRAKAGDADAEKKALAKIEEIEKRAKKEDFAKLAAEFSEDPGSKSKGGLIDYFSRGKMVPEFEQAAFTQKPNELGKPVKTEYGYHLIQVLDKKAAVNRTEADVSEEIAGILIAKDKSKVAVEKLQEALKKGDEAAVKAFVTEHKLKWEETGAFDIQTENVPKIGPNEEVVRTAFRLTPEKPLADALMREGGRALIVRYKAVPADKKDEKKDDKSELVAEMKGNRRSEEVIRKWVDDLRKSARIAPNPQLFAKQQPIED